MLPLTLYITIIVIHYLLLILHEFVCAITFAFIAVVVVIVVFHVVGIPIAEVSTVNRC